MKKQQQRALVFAVLVLLAEASVTCAEFPHQGFNTNVVTRVLVCKPDFLESTETIDKDRVKVSVNIEEVVQVEISIKDEATVSNLHGFAKADACYVPHVRPKGQALCILAYLDGASRPLALIQLWSDGKYFIYEGYKEESGRLYKGHAMGNHGGCSCGLAPDLAKVAASLIKEHAPQRVERK